MKSAMSRLFKLRGLQPGIHFALWSAGYLLITLSIYVQNTAQGNPIFSFGTDNMGWLNGIQFGNHLRETLLLLFSYLLPRLFEDNWTAYLAVICAVIWLNSCLANLACQALARHYGLRGEATASIRSLAGGAAGLLVITYDTGVPLAVNAFVYPLNSLFLLLSLLAFMAYLRTSRLRHWVGLLVLYVVAAKSSSFSFLFPLVLLALEISTARGRPAWRDGLRGLLRYLPLFVVAVYETSFEVNPQVEGQLDVVGLLGLQVITSYLAHLGSVGSIFFTGSATGFVEPGFRLASGPGLAMAAVVALACAGLILALVKRAPAGGLPFVLFVAWGVCSFLPLLKGAPGQVAENHRAYYNIVGLSLLSGVMFGLLLQVLCRGRAARFRLAGCAAALVALLGGVAAARPGAVGGVSHAFSAPLARFPGCRQDSRCAPSGRALPRASSGIQGKQWLAPCGDASNQTLHGASLTGSDLHDIRLVGAAIGQSNLARANLSGSCAALIRISDTTLDGATLTGADFSSATLTRVSLRGTNLDRAIFKGSYHRGVVAGGASMKDANLYISEWNRCDLRAANLQRADLSSSVLDSCNLAGADLAGANLQYTATVSCDFSQADLRQANLAGSRHERLDLSGADLRGAVLTDADLGGANLIGARLEGSSVRGARLEGARVCRQDLPLMAGSLGTPAAADCPDRAGAR